MRRIGVLIALGIAVGVVVAVTVNAFVVTVARVESDSMAPTLHTGDVVALGRMGDPNRFDVVGFDIQVYPAGVIDRLQLDVKIIRAGVE